MKAPLSKNAKLVLELIFFSTSLSVPMMPSSSVGESFMCGEIRVWNHQVKNLGSTCENLVSFLSWVGDE